MLQKNSRWDNDDGLMPCLLELSMVERASHSNNQTKPVVGYSS